MDPSSFMDDACGRQMKTIKLASKTPGPFALDGRVPSSYVRAIFSQKHRYLVLTSHYGLCIQMAAGDIFCEKIPDFSATY